MSTTLPLSSIARLLWVEERARGLSRWTWGIPVTGAVQGDVVHTYYDPARSCFVVMGWVDNARDATMQAWARSMGAEPSLTTAALPQYRSRHHTRSYTTYQRPQSLYVPHRIRSDQPQRWQPRADAGRFTTEGRSLQTALEPWFHYGLIDSLAHRHGTVDRLCTPQHTEPVSLHALRDRQLLHALTGVAPGDDDELLGRLHGIARWGGIFSGTERRARGVLVRSLSPRGDHVAGIDRGVACTLAVRPFVRSECWFLLRPSLLQQQSWWAAPRDYGWEADPWTRYHEYNAQQLEKDHVYGPGTRRGAERHLKAIARSEQPNELYLPHSICIEDIDTVYVPSRLYGAAWRVMETVPRAYRPRVVGDLLSRTCN
jgi:hypothetical protein